MSTAANPEAPVTTRRGSVTRTRIVAAAAELMHQRGVAGTTTPAVRDAAGVSSSQIYHYFSDKDDLTRAVIAHHSDAILTAQGDLLADVREMSTLRQWRDAVVEAARDQNCVGGCPLGGLASELADDKPWAQEAVCAAFDRWSDVLGTALHSLIDRHVLRSDTKADVLATALLAALQGGLLLAKAQRSTAALEAGLDAVLDLIELHAVTAGLEAAT